MKNKEKGITLIALVITIVVLLLIAAVSINAIIGENGIIGKAKDSQTETDKAKIQEMINVAVNGSYDADTMTIDEELLRKNLADVYGFDGTLTKNEDTNEYSCNIKGLDVTIDNKGKTTIVGDLITPSGGDTPVDVMEVVYDKGTYADGWSFSTDNTYCGNKPTEHETYWDMAGSSFRLLWINKEMDLSEYDKAYLIVDNADTLDRIWFALYPNQTNGENVIYFCSGNSTVTQQEDGLYLIEWDLTPATRKSKFGMSAWGGTGTRKLYKLAFHKISVPKNEKIIYDYGTLSSDCQLLTEHDYSSKGNVYINNDNYEIASNGGYSTLYTNQIDFSKYNFLNVIVNNTGSLERIFIRKDPSQINHGEGALISCQDSGDNRKIVDVINLGDGKYQIRLCVKDINDTAAIAFDAYAGYGNRKVYKIWLE